MVSAAAQGTPGPCASSGDPARTLKSGLTRGDHESRARRDVCTVTLSRSSKCRHHVPRSSTEGSERGGDEHRGTGAASAQRRSMQFDDQNFSLADAVSFAVMQERGIRRAVTFDAHFATAGFEMIPALKPIAHGLAAALSEKAAAIVFKWRTRSIRFIGAYAVRRSRARPSPSLLARGRGSPRGRVRRPSQVLPRFVERFAPRIRPWQLLDEGEVAALGRFQATAVSSNDTGHLLADASIRRLARLTRNERRLLP